jgi:threonine dehydratase
MDLVTPADVRAAAARLEGVLHTTPVEVSRALSRHVGVDVVLKCENLQRTGSFKLRGAYNRIAVLSDEEKARGVVCASAGNHAQGVALAAQMLGVKATVYMPEQAPLPKVEATRDYGADVCLVGEAFEDTLAAATEEADEAGAVFVHPFDHRDVVAGQGTLGLELASQMPDAATVVVPVGGGGLISGLAVALRDVRPELRIVGVQSEAAAGFCASLAAGELVAAPGEGETIADGIAVREPGELTWAHVSRLVDDVVAVDDATLARAVVLLLERAKLGVEPAGAAGVAAILSGQLGTPPGPVAVVLSGGNIDLLLLHHLITSGLTAEGRFVTVRTKVPDRPGALYLLLGIVAELRANIVGVEHQRFGRRTRLEEVDVVLELETRGPQHVDELREQLVASGYPFEVL